MFSVLKEVLRFLLWTHAAITLVMLLGMLAVYVLLPRPRRFSPLLGGVAAAGALLLAGLTLGRAEAVSAEVVLFYTFSAIAIVAGGMLVTQHNPVHAALSFALVVLSTCGLFLLQAAPFLMAATIIVYAGAIVVTFLFVIMLAQQAGHSDADQRSREPFLSSFAGFVLLGTLVYVLQVNYDARAAADLLQPRIEKIRLAILQERVADIEEVLGPEFIDEFEKLAKLPRSARDRDTISHHLWDMQAHWEDWKEKNDLTALRTALSELDRTATVLLVERQGSLQPRGNRPLSRFSGVPANEPFHKVARDAQGRVRVPADNTATLGRSLFTDYLLAVELAGALLLVAAIGAIAIAGRRTEGLR